MSYVHGYDTPLRASIALRCHLNRAAEKADAGDWEESLASLDDARLTLNKLIRFARTKAGAQKTKEAA